MGGEAMGDGMTGERMGEGTIGEGMGEGAIGEGTGAGDALGMALVLHCTLFGQSQYLQVH